MRLNVYTIFDSASGAYMRPFFMQSDGQAMRAFQDLSVDKEHDIGRHPEDYSLYRIGTYDDETGQLHPEDRSCLATAQEVIARSREIQPGSLKEFNYGGTS